MNNPIRLFVHVLCHSVYKLRLEIHEIEDIRTTIRHGSWYCFEVLTFFYKFALKFLLFFFEFVIIKKKKYTEWHIQCMKRDINYTNS